MRRVLAWARLPEFHALAAAVAVSFTRQVERAKSNPRRTIPRCAATARGMPARWTKAREVFSMVSSGWFGAKRIAGNFTGNGRQQ
jgi:hypothetical protein